MSQCVSQMGLGAIAAVTLCVTLTVFAKASWCQQLPPQGLPIDADGGQTSVDQNKPSTIQTGANVSGQELANQVNNPAAPVTFIQFREILVPNYPGAKGAISGLEMEPVVPIGPFHSLPFTQLMKITFPMVISTPGAAPPVGCIACGTGNQGVTGSGDVQVFDLISIKQSWGRWGFGPALSFPTASETQLGSGKWEAGPSAALMYTGIKNLTAGIIMQNPISFAGSLNRQSVNQMIITPTFTFNLKDGWFVGMSDYNFTFDWEESGAATIPLGMQLGKIIRIGKQPVSMSFEAGGLAARPAGTANTGWILGFELSPIFNFHLGPGEKVKVRGKR
jgi:hypothetical protein